MIEAVKSQVSLLLDKDQSGHGTDHINRVLDLSLKFCKKEKANKDIVSLIALLHDVDDYKLFGIDSANNLTNARAIMDHCGINFDIQQEVCFALRCIGYSKRLKGLVPNTIEGMVVSDADMCDALGANGILREYAYCMNHNKPFFDKNNFPTDELMKTETGSICANSSVCHMFEKILKLRRMMLTESGKIEAEIREKIVIDFLYQLFREEDAIEWIDYLNQYLKEERTNYRKRKINYDR